MTCAGPSRLVCGVVATLLLAGCGGGPAPDPGPPPDLRIDQANRAGTRALALNHPAEAVRQYREALTRAYERDDPGAIGDIGYNLAVAQLRLGEVQAALRTVRETRAELERRHLQPPPELLLVHAAAAYRAGDTKTALSSASEILDRPSRDADTTARAWYIRGMILAERGDAAGVREAVAAIPASAQADIEADRLELQGRAALLEGRPADALASFEQSVGRRREALDYRGMARGLSLAGEASLALDRRRDAATYFLRAGRSLILQGDTAGGNARLNRAETLARQSGARDIIAEIARLRRVAVNSGDAPAGRLPDV